MEEIANNRRMPQSKEAEQAVIGAMIIDRDAVVIAMEIIKPEDFYYKQYGVLFEAITSLYQAGDPIDIITIQNKLGVMGISQELCGMEQITEITLAVPTSANVKAYANVVKEKSILRNLIHTTEEIENMCYGEKGDVEEIMGETEKKLFTLLQNRGSGDYVPIKDIVLNALQKIEQAARNQGSVTGIPTGFIDLDYKTAGLQPSDLILVAARPSMGKTAFVLNIAQYVAFHEQMATAIFSLEMSKEQLVNRLLALESRVDAQQLRTGNLTDADWAKLAEGAGGIGRSPLLIDDTPSISVAELRSKCRKFKLEHDLKLIIIDYLQLMSGNGRSESKQQEVAEISKSLKAIARELNVPVIALSQLSRAVEQRPDHKPMLSDLRESGSIEQDADMVLFIHRLDYQGMAASAEEVGVTQLIIAKHRNGEIGDVPLRFHHEEVRFVDEADSTFRQADVVNSAMNDDAGPDPLAYTGGGYSTGSEFGDTGFGNI